MDSADAATLLCVAREAVEAGVRFRRALELDAARFPAGLRDPRASFVTLRRSGALRGCVGSLEAARPLIADVARNARAAACADPRFPPIGVEELELVEPHVSILGAPVPISFASEAELAAQLRPGVDGLILRAGGRSATFLPAVWEGLPDPRAFLSELKRKAGLAPGDWPAGVRAERYTVESVPDSGA